MERKYVEFQLTELEADFTAKKTVVEDKIRSIRVMIENQRKEHEAIIVGLKVSILELETELSGIKRDYTAERAEIMKQFCDGEGGTGSADKA